MCAGVPSLFAVTRKHISGDWLPGLKRPKTTVPCEPAAWLKHACALGIASSDILTYIDSAREELPCICLGRSCDGNPPACRDTVGLRRKVAHCCISPSGRNP